MKFQTRASTLNGMALWLAISGIWYLPIAQAADSIAAPFCTTADQIDEHTESCDDNDAFIIQGDACLDRFDKLVAEKAAGMQKNFVKNDGKYQKLNFNTSLKDYNLSSAALAQLIGFNQQAISDVTEYLDATVTPEDTDSPDATEGMDPQAWADSWSCYGDTRTSIREILQDFQNRLSSLQAAKAIVDGNGATSGGRQENVGAITDTPNKMAKGTKGQGSGKPVPKGKSQNPSSDITGVKEDEQKQIPAP